MPPPLLMSRVPSRPPSHLRHAPRHTHRHPLRAPLTCRARRPRAKPRTRASSAAAETAERWLGVQSGRSCRRRPRSCAPRREAMAGARVPLGQGQRRRPQAAQATPGPAPEMMASLGVEMAAARLLRQTTAPPPLRNLANDCPCPRLPGWRRCHAWRRCRCWRVRAEPTTSWPDPARPRAVETAAYGTRRANSTAPSWPRPLRRSASA